MLVEERKDLLGGPGNNSWRQQLGWKAGKEEAELRSSCRPSANAMLLLGVKCPLLPLEVREGSGAKDLGISREQLFAAGKMQG